MAVIKFLLKIVGGFFALVIGLAIIVKAYYLVTGKEPPPPKETQQTTQNVQTTPKAAPTICNIPGLGDLFTSYDSSSQFKLTNDSGIVKTFNDGQVVITFVESRAYNITIASTQDHKAYGFMKKMVPKDSVKGKSETDESDATVSYQHTYYTSESLKSVFPKSNGNFDIIHAFDKSTGNYLHTVIAVDNQKE